LFDYSDLRFTIVRKNDKRPLEEKWQEVNNYSYNDPKIQNALKEGYNLGIVCGYGCLVVLDVDKKGRDFAEVNEIAKDFLPKTLTIKTQSGGRHYYFFCPEIQSEIILKDGMGEIRSRGNQVLCPPSQINGNKYEIEINEPIAAIKREQLLTVLQKWLTTREKAEPQILKEEENIKIADFIDLKMLTKRGNEYYGTHPLHGSESGMNFWINTEKNVFHCFRHASGGGVLSWIAVKEGLIKCEDAQRGALGGAVFLKLLQICRDKYKLEIETKKEFFAIEMGNFDIKALKEVFKDTHNHLSCFNDVDEDLGLIGENYYAIKKAICYLLMASSQNAVTFRIGKDYYDNRINLLGVTGSGLGKGIMKNFIRRIVGKANVMECSGLTHPEQLIGKKIKRRDETIENKGYFGAKILIHDEAQDVLNETDQWNAQCMNIMRKAQDTFGFNLIDKKLVDNFTPFEYCPETMFLTFMHPVILKVRFFDTGSFRRYFCFNIEIDEKRDIADSVKNLLAEIKEINLEQFRMRNVAQIKFSQEAIEEIIRWVLQFNKFLLFNPCQSARIMGEKTFYSLKGHFIRLAAILSVWNGENEVSKETARVACRDCVQFLLENFDYYINYGQSSLSSNIWRTSDSQEAMLLEWLYYSGALNQDASKTSIMDCQEAIGDFFGVNERQARSVLNRLRKSGLVASRKGRGVSKVWLNFSPKLETIKKPVDSINILSEFKDFVNEEVINRGNRGNVLPIPSLCDTTPLLCISDTNNDRLLYSITPLNSEIKNSIAPIAPIGDKTTENKPTLPLLPLNQENPKNPAELINKVHEICKLLAGDFNAPFSGKALSDKAKEQGIFALDLNEAIAALYKAGELQHLPGKEGWRLVRKERAIENDIEAGGAENA